MPTSKRKRAEQLNRHPPDWAKIDALTDEDIDAQITADPDAAPPGRYIRSGTGIPSNPRPVVSTRSVSAHSASLLSRTGPLARSTGHCS
jgi:hypothetical protein